MSILSSFISKRLKPSTRNKRIAAICVLFIVLIIPFQNCSEKYQSSLNQADMSSLNGGTSSGGGATPPPPPGGGDAGMTLEQKQSACRALLAKPAILTVSASETTMKVGLGTASSGDMSSPNLDLSASRGISDPARWSSLGCDTQFGLNLVCEVVSDDPTKPLSVTNAISGTGANFLSTATPLELAKASFMNNNCSAGFAQGASSVKFMIRPNSGNGPRCFESSFWIKLTLNNLVAGANNKGFTSDPMYLKVTSTNGCWMESRLKDSTGALPAVVNFGTTVAINQNWAAVVAPTDDIDNSVIDVGSVYMYNLVNGVWTQKQKIFINESISKESIGAVALRGDTMVIGSPYRNGKGAIYFYKLTGSTWTLIQSVDPQEAMSSQDFGSSIVMNGSTIFVGSPSYSSAGLNKRGAVSVYQYNSSGMTFVKMLVGESAYSAFGTSLAADIGVLAVGAPQSIGKESLAAGSVYLFSDSGGSWNLITKKSGNSTGEKFGASIAVLGTKLLVGSPNFSDTKIASGRATYFDNYMNASTKVYTGSEENGQQGQSVAMSSKGIFIATPYGLQRAGFVDHYSFSALNTIVMKLQAYNAGPNSAFGWSIATSDTDIVIGARIKNDPNDNSGAAYIYRYK